MHRWSARSRRREDTKVRPLYASTRRSGRLVWTILAWLVAAWGCSGDGGGTRPTPRGSLTGRVRLVGERRDAAGESTGVLAIADADGVPVELARDSAIVDTVLTTAGAFRFENIEPGSYRAIARRPPSPDDTTETLLLEGGDRSFLDTLSLAGSGDLEVAPNPTPQSARIDFSLSASGQSDLEVLSQSGTVIRRLLGDVREAGRYAVVWDGATDSGAPAGGGPFWVVLRAEGGVGCALVVREPFAIPDLWPNADGAWWEFGYQERVSADTMPPAIAGLDPDGAATATAVELDERLSLPLPASVGSADSTVGTLRLEFDGTVTLPAGTKQNLAGTFTSASGASRAIASPILARIYRARPDLRAEMVRHRLVSWSLTRAADATNVGPLFLIGGYFDKRETWMGYYPEADVGADSAYTIVRAPLTPGATFRHQLVPALADDIFEHGKIFGQKTVVTALGTFEAIEVVYFIDLGESEVTDEFGTPIGTFRSFAISLVQLVPGVGPVYQRGYDALVPASGESDLTPSVSFHEAILTRAGRP